MTRFGKVNGLIGRFEHDLFFPYTEQHKKPEDYIYEPSLLNGSTMDPLVMDQIAEWSCPIERPSKIICIGRNYRAHAKELSNPIPSEPLCFLKAPSALLPHNGTIILPSQSKMVQHEVELAVIIGKKGKGIKLPFGFGI